jgi:ribosomal protein L30E
MAPTKVRFRPKDFNSSSDLFLIPFLHSSCVRVEVQVRQVVREHQLATPACRQVWKVHPWLQVRPQGHEVRKGCVPLPSVSASGCLDKLGEIKRVVGHHVYEGSVNQLRPRRAGGRRTQPILRPECFAQRWSSSINNRTLTSYALSLFSCSHPLSTHILCNDPSYVACRARTFLPLASAKLILLSKNTPPLRRAEIEYYAMLSKTAVHRYEGTNVTLGTAAGRLFRVGVMTISDAGDSDLVSLPFFTLPCLPRVPHRTPKLIHSLVSHLLAHRCRKRDCLNHLLLMIRTCCLIFMTFMTTSESWKLTESRR